MRRRLFWTLAGVAAVTGFLVLLGSVVATQRAAVEATRRELKRSSDEVVAIIDGLLEAGEENPRAIGQLILILEGERAGPLLGQIRRVAGTSDLGFGAITSGGDLRTGASIFSRVALDIESLQEGEEAFVTSTSNELVLVTPVPVSTDRFDATVLVALARATPVVRLGDVGRGLVILGVGILLVAAVLARFLSGQITRRLQPLEVASRDLAAGDLSARVPDLGDPELNDVASAFNEMAGELETAREREREFILGIGHDLRTPLTTIAGYAEALETGEVESEEELERVGTVLGRQSHQMSRLIEDLSLLARLEQPEFGLRTEDVDVGAHVHEVAEGFRAAADEAGVRLVVETDGGLVASTDPDRLGQIVQNLVENALRFTPEMGTVTVKVSGVDGGVAVAVVDTGIGIDPDDLPRVFDRHFIGKRRQVRREGSGLGLSIVKGLVDRMGASVVVDSAPGRGTTVTCVLPVAQRG